MTAGDDFGKNHFASQLFSNHRLPFGSASRPEASSSVLPSFFHFYSQLFFFLNEDMWLEHGRINISVGAPACLLAGGCSRLRATLVGPLAGADRSPANPTNPYLLPHLPHPNPFQPPPAVVEVHILPPTQRRALMALNAAALFPERLWWS